VPWKGPASNSLYEDATSKGAKFVLLSQVQYSPSLPDDKPGKLLSFTREQGNKLAGTFDPEAWLRGLRTAVLERELERESRPEPLLGLGNAEMCWQGQWNSARHNCKNRAIARTTQMPHRTQKWHYQHWE